MADITWNEALWRRVMAEVRLSPSPHNTQPAYFSRQGDMVSLWEDPARQLHVGDASGRDQRAALGIAATTFAMVLSKYNLTWDMQLTTTGDAPVWPASVQHPQGLRQIARGDVKAAVSKGVDPLVDFLAQRMTWRMPFAPASAEAIQAISTRAAHEQAVWIDAPAFRDIVVACSKKAAKACVAWRALHDELWAWMRLSPQHPRWHVDGMNAEALGMTGIEAKAASMLLHPRLVGVWEMLGIPSSLLAETGPIQSASGFLLLLARRDEDSFVTGGRMMHLWLEVTRAGLALCPMSALADYDETAKILWKSAGFSDAAWQDERLVNIFRVGAPIAAKRKQQNHARITVEELCL